MQLWNKRKKHMKIYQNTSLKCLRDEGLLTERAFHALTGMGVKTAGQLIGYKGTGWEVQHNIGLGAIMDTDAFFTKLESGQIKYAESISEDPDAISPEKSEPPVATRESTIKAYESISGLSGIVPSFLYELFPDSEKMESAILNGEYDVLTVQRDLGRMGNIELRKLLQHYLKTVRKYESKEEHPSRTVLRTAKKLIRRLSANLYSFPREVIWQDFLSIPQRQKLQQMFDALASWLSAEARALLRQHLPSFTDVLQLFGMPEALVAEKFGFKPGRATIHEIWRMNQTLEDAFSEEVFSDQDAWLYRRIGHCFPWLSPADRRFVFRFQMDNGSMPLFFIALKLVESCHEKSINIWAYTNGIIDGERHTMKEIGAIFNQTQERPRQLTWEGKGILERTMKRFTRWGDYSSLLASSYISELSPHFRRIQEQERLPQDFKYFCVILTLLDDYEVVRLKDKEAVVRNQLRQYISMIDLREMQNLSVKKYARDTVFDLHALVTHIPAELQEDAVQFLCQWTEANTGIHFGEDGKGIFKQNHVDVGEEAYLILKEHGKPMPLKTLFRKFKRRYPDHKYTDIEQFRVPILIHEHIKAKGHASIYGLDTWDNVYYGNIRDLLRLTMEASPVPVHIDELTEAAQKHFPKTNVASIISSMKQCEKTFVPFQGNCYGLATKNYPPEYIVQHPVLRGKRRQKPSPKTKKTTRRRR